MEVTRKMTIDTENVFSISSLSVLMVLHTTMTHPSLLVFALFSVYLKDVMNVNRGKNNELLHK